MAFLQWRRFNFFEKELVKDPETNTPLQLFKDCKITCTTNGRGHIIVGDSVGKIHIISRQFTIENFQAFEHSVMLLQQLRQNAILVSVGSNDSDNSCIAKLWNVEKLDRSGKPSCLRIIKITPGLCTKQVTAICAHESLNLMAIGLEDGNIILFRGDITREKQSKHKIINIGSSPITGLAYKFLSKIPFLFVASTKEICSLNLAAKDKETNILLDSHGCPPKCSAMTDEKSDFQFIVARKEAVYFYQPDGRGPCLAFDGEKILIHWFRGNLVVVGRDSHSNENVPPSSIANEMNIVTIYDINNKFIAYSAPLSNVLDIISESGCLYVLTRDGKFYSLIEKDTQSKLDLLFKKSQYSLAISLAKSHQYDSEGLAAIFTQYGDHLYNKRDYDGAVNQYIKAIGSLEASYVIRKFLDAQKIHYLTAYLEALHLKGCANEDHTTLLLNCYTNLKDIEKLEKFLSSKDKETINFDVEIAIKGCRDAGYFAQALSLAEDHKQHGWYLKIQLEDNKDYKKALDYISKLDFDQAEANMKKYGKILINEVPQETTELLKKLCTDFGPPQESGIGRKANAEEFIHIFVNNQVKLLEFLEHMVKVDPFASEMVYGTLLELYLQTYNHLTDEGEKKAQEKKIMAMLVSSESNIDIGQALILCQINQFQPAILHLYEKSKLYKQILAFYIDVKDHDSILKACERFGEVEPGLWVEALWYFSQQNNESANTTKYLSKIIGEIERARLLPPIMVVEILSQSPIATLELVRDYLIRHLRADNERVAEDERLIKQYSEDTSKMRAQIKELRAAPKVFQAAKCSGCTHQLELPSVHFLCGHSYHQHCFESYSAENEYECPLCLHENKKILDILRAQEQNKDIHEQFNHHLERSDDGFSVVAEYFGRGVFNSVTLITDNKPLSKNPFE